MWIATRRRGVDYHAIDVAGMTVCGRSTHAGELIPTDHPWLEHIRPCPRCWPEPAEGGA